MKQNYGLAQRFMKYEPILDIQEPKFAPIE